VCGGFTPGMNLIWGDIPPINLRFLGIFSSGFENLINLCVILRHLETELSIFKRA
jgi:hypothetical protein